MRYLIFLSAFIFTLSLYAGEQGSQTFMTIRPPFQSGSAEYQSMFWIPRSCNNSFLEIAPFGGASTNGDIFSGYFLPYDRTELLTAEDMSSDSVKRDLSAINFNIKTNNETFSSFSAFTAKQSIAGLAFIWRQTIINDWYVEFVAPVEQVTRTVCIKEDIRNDGGGVASGTGLDESPYVNSLTAAFAQSNWKYGRIISGCEMKKSGLADLEVKIGYNSKPFECLYIYAYAGAVFPTGNKPEAKFIFEPIVGNNHHYGILLGSSGIVEFWRCKEHILQWGFSMNSRYLCHNHQLRSFDLTDKEFGRYLETYDSPFQAETAEVNNNVTLGTSGINVFTHRVKVSPGFSSLVSTVLLYTFKGLDLELGYTLFARQAEDVEIAWDENPQVKDIAGEGKTNIARTIRYDFPNDAIVFGNYNALTVRDLDLASAATPITISYTLSLGLGYTAYKNDAMALFVGLGGSYELESGPVGFNRWMVWGKIGLYY